MPEPFRRRILEHTATSVQPAACSWPPTSTSCICHNLEASPTFTCRHRFSILAKLVLLGGFPACMSHCANGPTTRARATPPTHCWAWCVYWQSLCLALRYFGSYEWDLSHTARVLRRCKAGDVLQDEAADHANVRVRPDLADDGAPQNADECGPNAVYAIRVFGQVHVPCPGAYGCPYTSMHCQWPSRSRLFVSALAGADLPTLVRRKPGYLIDPVRHSSSHLPRVNSTAFSTSAQTTLHATLACCGT